MDHFSQILWPHFPDSRLDGGDVCLMLIIHRQPESLEPWILLPLMLSHADHPPGPRDRFDLLGVFEVGDGANIVDGFELAGGRSDVDLRGGDGTLGQHRDDIVADLCKTAVDEVAVHVGTVLVRSSPKPSRPINGARPGITPSSPSNSGRATKSTHSSNRVFSGVTTTHLIFLPPL